MNVNSTLPKVCIILPCYNEQEVIGDTFKEVFTLLNQLLVDKTIGELSTMAFIDDGSKDDTWQCICELKKSNPSIKAIKLSRNFGHQHALLAGIQEFYESYDCLITIDADLQDDISVIPQMLEKFRNGTHIVYGVRNDRDSDTFFKRSSALFYYYLLKKLGVKVVVNHADFRLASKTVLTELLKYGEINLFLRGIFPTIGFKNDIIKYRRKKRLAGETKYPLRKMLAFAIDGVTSFSIVPLRLITYIGLFIFIGSIIASIYVLYSYLYKNVVHGWASTALPLYLLGGIQMLFLGVMGEYIGKIYKEVKNRPRFIVEDRLL